MAAHNSIRCAQTLKGAQEKTLPNDVHEKVVIDRLSRGGGFMGRNVGEQCRSRGASK